MGYIELHRHLMVVIAQLPNLKGVLTCQYPNAKRRKEDAINALQTKALSQSL